MQRLLRSACRAIAGLLSPFAPFTTRQAMENLFVSLTLVRYWLVMALFTTFSAVYDARLYVAVQSSSQQVCAASSAWPAVVSIDG
jgi:hypothetical protein